MERHGGYWCVSRPVTVRVLHGGSQSCIDAARLESMSRIMVLMHAVTICIVLVDRMMDVGRRRVAFGKTLRIDARKPRYFASL